MNRTPSLKSRGVEKSLKNLQTLKLIVGRTNYNQGIPRTGRKQTQTVTFQFQQSLNQLMETLSQANPFFVRCIKSNSEKTPNSFDDMLVLVQLRYTGMLETVRIRQSGYSVRLSFEEFIQHYRILLSKGLLSSQNDIKDFLSRMNLNRDNYQMGKTKIFMRESEKLVLDNLLHQEILQRIITLQRWVRTWITRRRFLQMKNAAVCLQTYTRRWIAQQRLEQLKTLFRCDKAALTIQKSWKSFRERSSFVALREATVKFQSHARGLLSRREFRRRYSEMRERQKQQQQQRQQKATVSMPNVQVMSNGDCQSAHSDEAFLSKGSSQEEIEIERIGLTALKPVQRVRQQSKDSEDSSGVHEESESETSPNDNVPAPGTLESPPPPLPPRRSSQAHIEITGEDESAEGNEKSRLDRRRNKPLRKLSLKRSKSIAKEPLSPGGSDANADLLNVKIPLREMASEPYPMPLSTEQRGPDEMQSHQKGAFQACTVLLMSLLCDINV